MRSSPHRIGIAMLAVLVAFSGVFAAPGRPATASKLAILAQRAVSTDTRSAAAAIAALRGAGPAGLDALFAAHAGILGREITDPSRQRLTRALDAVARQKDAFAARLYWYTDLEQAKAAARASGRPILSLRLLGNVDDDLSCANSRFFRTVLYANRDVSRALREQFVLHWQSERPAPRITIDFGDGRALITTITGNSIHYLLDAEGRPLDALPGLWSPRRFLAELTGLESLAKVLAQAKDDDWTRRLVAYHQGRLEELAREWPDPPLSEALVGERPDAYAAGNLTRSKMIREWPVVRSVVPGMRLVLRPLDFIPEAIREVEISAADLDSASVALMRTKLARGAAPRVAKQDLEERLGPMVASLQSSVGDDAALNRFVLHRQIHQWFTSGAGMLGLERLNRRVYDELFLTPSSDPWLGLLAPDAYLGLDGNGVAHAERPSR